MRDKVLKIRGSAILLFTLTHPSLFCNPECPVAQRLSNSTGHNGGSLVLKNCPTQKKPSAKTSSSQARYTQEPLALFEQQISPKGLFVKRLPCPCGGPDGRWWGLVRYRQVIECLHPTFPRLLFASWLWREWLWSALCSLK